MLSLFTPLLKKALSSTLCVTMLALSVPGAITSAAAAPACSNGESALRGQDPECAARKIGSQIVTYPRTTWTELGYVTVPDDGSAPNVTWLGGGDVAALGNTSAAALELDSSQVVSMVTQFPTNVPYVFARYNPVSGTMRVDLMKVEETLTNSGKRLGLYRSLFTPKHGDYWKAARQYISPDQYEQGDIVGNNPFQAFMHGNDDMFYKVSNEGTQVIVGHAMRFTGAPMGVLQVAAPRISTTTKKSGSVWRKKVTTTWWGHLKPSWWLAYPTSVLSRDSTQPIRSYCINDISENAECPMYQAATSGVAFEEFKGGMLDSTEETWELRSKTKKGFTFLTMFIAAVLIGFATMGLMSAVAPAMFASNVGLINSAFAFTGLAVSGAVGGAIGAAAIHYSMAIAGMMIFGGANLGGTYSLDEKFLFFGVVSSANMNPPEDLDEDNEKLSRVYAEPRTTSDFINGGETLIGWQRTVTGSCGLGQSAEECAGSGGITPRTTMQPSSSGASTAAQDVTGNRIERENSAGGSHGGIRR